VARRIDEYDALALHVRFVRADMLRDSARFAASYVGFSYGIQQAGLSVIDVAHHGDYRRA
jgi:hypothetical protein